MMVLRRARPSIKIRNQRSVLPIMFAANFFAAKNENSKSKIRGRGLFSTSNFRFGFFENFEAPPLGKTVIGRVAPLARVVGNILQENCPYQSKFRIL